MAKITDRQKEELQLLSLELNDEGKRKYTQQVLANKFGISKGMVNRYIKEKVNKVNKIIDDEVRVVGEFENIQKEKSKHLTKSEQIEVNKQIKSKLHYQGRIFTTVEATLNLFDSILKDGYVEEKVNVGDGVQQFEKRGLNTSDGLNIINGADKASVTLGVNERFSSSNVQVNNANVQQETIVVEIE